MGAIFVPFDDLKTSHSIPYSRVHLARLVKSGNFPAPVKLSPNRIAWVLEEIEAWNAARLAARAA